MIETSARPFARPSARPPVRPSRGAPVGAVRPFVRPVRAVRLSVGPRGSRGGRGAPVGVFKQRITLKVLKN